MKTQKAAFPAKNVGEERWNPPHSTRRVVELLGLGATVASVAKRFGVSRTTIYNALKKETAPQREAAVSPRNIENGDGC